MATIHGLTVTIGADTSKFNRDIKQLDRDVNQTAKRIDTLSESLKIEWDPSRFARAQQEAQRAIEVTDLKAKSLREQLAFLETSGKTNTADYQKLQTEIVQTEAKAVSLKQRLKEIQEIRIEHLASQFAKTGQSIQNLGKAIAPVSAAAAAMLASFAAMATSAVKFGDEIGTTAQQLNISGEALQKWLYIAQQTDVGQSEMVTGLTKIQAALAELATGESTKATQALEHLGISTSKAAGGMSANFEDIITSLSNVTSSTEQAALANEIFGAKLGSKIIPMLNDGGAGLNKLASEFEALGYLTEDQINGLDAFEDVIDRLKYQFSQLKNEIGVALLPIMNQMVGFIESKVIPAVRNLTDWFTGLDDSQKKTIFGVLGFVAALGPALMIIGKLTSGIGSVIKMASSLGGSLSALAANPVFLAIGAAVALLGYLYTTSEEFRASINRLVEAIGSALAPIFDNMISMLKLAFTIIKPLADLLGIVLAPVIEWIAKKFENVAKGIQVVMKWMTDFYTFLYGWIGPILENVVGKIREFFNSIPLLAQNAINKVIDWVEGAINFIIGKINWIIDQINKVGDVLGFTIGRLDEVDLESNINIVRTGGEVARTTTQSPAQVAVESIATAAPAISNSTIQNDYSNKNITINVEVYNYGEEVDVDDLVRQINMKLAKEF